MSKTLRERYGYLPNVLRLVLESAGENAMLRLWATHGGIRVFPTTLRQSMPGDSDTIIKMMKKEHLTHIDVPIMIHALQHARQRRIEELRREGKLISDIARTVGMSERGVSRALARARARQIDVTPRPRPFLPPRSMAVEHRI